MIDYITNVWKPLIEILFLWYLFYLLLLFIKGTRAFQVFKGLAIIIITAIIAVSFVTQRLELFTLNWIVQRFFAVLVIAVLILFQPELRQGLARIGQRGVFSLSVLEEHIIEEIVNAAALLSKKKIGALITIERDTSLRTYLESGISMDAEVTRELLNTIFMPNTPLHDGGVIIRAGRILAAGCLFPLTENPYLSKSLGTRHRAGIGLTEETDAVVVIVSEETGAISLAVNGKLTRNVDREALERMLKNLCSPKPKEAKKSILRMIRRGRAK